MYEGFITPGVFSGKYNKIQEHYRRNMSKKHEMMRVNESS
jgi:hypothetical protein